MQTQKTQKTDTAVSIRMKYSDKIAVRFLCISCLILFICASTATTSNALDVDISSPPVIFGPIFDPITLADYITGSVEIENAITVDISNIEDFWTLYVGTNAANFTGGSETKPAGDLKIRVHGNPTYDTIVNGSSYIADGDVLVTSVTFDLQMDVNLPYTTPGNYNLNLIFSVTP